MNWRRLEAPVGASKGTQAMDNPIFTGYHRRTKMRTSTFYQLSVLQDLTRFWETSGAIFAILRLLPCIKSASFAFQNAKKVDYITTLLDQEGGLST
mmetsp:Transcript_3387/g.7784  ORF Transcript_3387/g.7784 Transcript_3387/m.7784 type:complete len:96 (+) Transcript_3387:1134-1421(+)